MDGLVRTDPRESVRTVRQDFQVSSLKDFTDFFFEDCDA